MTTGIVKWFSVRRGIGCITPQDGSDDAVVLESAVSRAGFKEILKGQSIDFDLVPDRRTGRTLAENLKLTPQVASTRPPSAILRDYSRRGRGKLRYLGVLRGSGLLKHLGVPIARADYVLDGFVLPSGQVTGTGEIRMAPDALLAVFIYRELSLVTDEGQNLRIRFSEKKLGPDSVAAHIDVTEGLPGVNDWRH